MKTGESSLERKDLLQGRIKVCWSSTVIYLKCSCLLKPNTCSFFLFLHHVLKWRMTLINCIWITNYLWQISEVVGKRRKMPSKCFLTDLKIKILVCLLLLKVLSIHTFCLKPFIKWPLIMHYSIFMGQHSNCPTGTLNYSFKVMKLIINFIIYLIFLAAKES